MHPNVKRAAAWLADVLPEIPISLKIKSSSRVPGGIEDECLGIESVLRTYRWRSEWSDEAGVVHKSEDWNSTERSLALAKPLLNGAAVREAESEVQRDLSL
jgi:hypothetical protein